MPTASPFTITVYDKNYRRQGVVRAPASLNVLQVWNTPGQAAFVLNASDAKIPVLAAKGSRCVISYQAPGIPRHTLMSGLVSQFAGTSGVGATRTFTVMDDLDALNEIIGHPVPGQPLSNQSATGYDTRTGPLGDVIKAYVSANVTGQGIRRLAVAANAGDGPRITQRIRMHNLGEVLLPVATAHGLGVRVVQVGATRQLQTWTPETYPRVLTEESGIVQSAEFSITPPEVTRVVVGIGGEDVAREFFGDSGGFVNTAAEDEWGIRRKEFIDARDIEQTDPNKAALALARATERLQEGAAKASLKAELAETSRFQYWKAFKLGAQMSVKPSGVATITDRVREIEFDWQAGNPRPVITPRIGEWSDSQDDQLYRVVGSALRRITDLETR